MNTTDTSGPVFPGRMNVGYDGEFSEGMTLRDYFAAKAMQSYLVEADRDSFTWDECAMASYEMADAMLKARKA